MKKVLVSALCLLALMFVTCLTLAEERPINPYQHRVWENEALAKSIASSDDSPKSSTTSGPVTIECVRQPSLDGYGTWYIALDPSYNYTEIICWLSMKDYTSDYTTVFSKEYKSNPEYFSTCNIYSGGDYQINVMASKNGRGYIASETFHINDDASHTSLDEKIAQVVNSCKASTQWQTALNLHDWLTTHVYYDENYEYYGADMILRGYGVCDGYSKAYLMMCRKAGIPVGRVTNTNHAWNAIKLEGQWYYVDPTWDDPAGGTKAISGHEGHDYFCINEELLFLDHSDNDFAKDSNIGACTSLDMNYSIKTGEWKQWGTGFNSTAPTKVFDEIYQAIEEGKTIYSIDDNQEIYYEVLNGAGYYDTGIRKKRIIGYGLKNSLFSLPNGGSIKVSVTEKPIKVTFLGWNINEAGTLKIPAGVKEVPTYGFYGIASTTVQIPPGCTKINTYAFADSKVRTVIIPPSVTSIADNAFNGCGRIVFVTSNSLAIQYAKQHGMLVMAP